VSSFEEGCVTETIAVAIAAEQLAGATNPMCVETLEMIEQDESRHAALAWSVVAWAVRAGGEPVREAISASLQRVLTRHPVVPNRGSRPSEDADVGVLTREAMRRVSSEVVAAVVQPCAAALLHSSAGGSMSESRGVAAA